VKEDITLKVTATDEHGCIQEKEIMIRVSDEIAIFIPNVFTPNGDQVNDLFFVSANPFIKEIEELAIYDRWGNYIFKRFMFSPNVPGDGWDGSFFGKPVDPGVFAYKVVVRFKDGRRKFYYGNVTLIR
jgi:gliding motility-associated-like protein